MTSPIITGATADSVSIATKLLELAERCERATGPDREIDVGIAIAVDWKWDGWEDGEASVTSMAAKYGFDWVLERADYGMNSILRGTPRYTASLDAAMTLVPEGLDPQICKGPMFALAANEERPWGVSLIGNAQEVEGEYGPELSYDSHDANAATAALSLCAASLRARAAQ